MPRIVSLDVKCEKNLMKVFIEFDKPFNGVIFSKGHYNNVNCVHVPAGLGRQSANFDVSINTCGTTGNTENGLYGYGSQVRHRGQRQGTIEGALIAGKAALTVLRLRLARLVPMRRRNGTPRVGKKAN